MGLRKLITDIVNSNGTGIDGLKEVSIPLVGIAADTTLPIFHAPSSVFIESIRVTSTAGSQDATLQVTNWGTGGAGTATLYASAFAMSGLTAKIPSSLGTIQNNMLAPGEVLALTVDYTSVAVTACLHIRYRASLGKGSA